MSSFSLDDIRSAAEAKYGNTDITFGNDTLVMLNPLRLPKEKRTELTKIQESASADDADQAEVLADAIRLVATNQAVANRFIKAVDGDLTVLSEVFSRYTEKDQAGEA